MKSLRAIVLLQLCLHFVCVLGRKSTDVCVLLKNCPYIWNLSSEEIEKNICGADGRYPKMWCTLDCVTPDGEKGVCAAAEQCKPFGIIYRNSDLNSTSRKAYIRKFICDAISSTQEQYVCCSKTLPNTPPTHTILHSTTSVPVQNTHFEDQCGIASDDFKIVGGTEANIGDHPWLVLLQYSNGRTMSFKCGGALINRRYVLTAAHCSDDRAGILANVVLGEHNISSPIDCYGRSCAPRPQTIRIQKVIKHPSWVNAKRQFYDDIALLKLAEDVQFTDFVKPICLPELRYKPSFSTKMTVAGWGRDDYGEQSKIKRLATVYLQGNSACLKTVNIPLSKQQLCVGGGKEDSCKGDSGGPLMASTEDRTGTTTWHLVGIISFGYNAPCGTYGRPGIYTAVSNYLGWIRANIHYT